MNNGEDNEGFEEEFEQQLPKGIQMMMLPAQGMIAPIDKLRKNLTQYEKTQIEFQQTAQSLEVLLSSWKFMEAEGLLDEVDRIKIHKLRVDKLAELIGKL